jgi:hypothetical protein
MNMNEMIKNCIIDMVDGVYDYCLIDNDTKKLEIYWGKGCWFTITLYEKNTEEDEWDEIDCWDSNNFINDFSELFSGEVDVISDMAYDIAAYVK